MYISQTDEEYLSSEITPDDNNQIFDSYRVLSYTSGLIEAPFLEQFEYQKNNQPAETKLSTITVSKKLNDFFNFASGTDTYAVTDSCPNGQIISIGSRTSKNIVDLNIPSDEEEYVFIDGFSSSTSISTGTLLNPLQKNIFLYLSAHFDNDTPFADLPSNQVLQNTQNGCVKQNNNLPQIVATQNLKTSKKLETNQENSPYFYSFFYKRPPVKDGTIFNKNLQNEEQSFVIIGDGYNDKRITIYHEIDHSIGYQIHYNNYLQNNNTTYYNGKSKSNILTDSDKFYHVVVQIYPKLNSALRATLVIYVDDEPVVMDEIELPDAKKLKPFKNRGNSYSRNVTIFTNKAINGLYNTNYIGDRTGYNWTPDGTKLAQLEIYYGIYNKYTSYKFRRRDKNGNIVNQIVYTYSPNLKDTTLENFKLFSNKTPLIKTAMSNDSVSDDSSAFIEEDSVSAFNIELMSNAKVDRMDTSPDMSDFNDVVDKVFYCKLNLTFETEPIEGSYFRYKIIYKKFEIFDSNILIKFTTKGK